MTSVNMAPFLPQEIIRRKRDGATLDKMVAMAPAPTIEYATSWQAP